MEPVMGMLANQFIKRVLLGDEAWGEDGKSGGKKSKQEYDLRDRQIDQCNRSQIHTDTIFSKCPNSIRKGKSFQLDKCLKKETSIVVQSLSRIWLFATPWTAVHQAPCPSSSPGACSTHVHWVGDAIKPSCPLSSPSPPALDLSHHQGLFQWVGSSHQVAKILELQINPSNEYSGLISFRIDWFDLLAFQGTLESSLAAQFKSINSLAISLLDGSTLTSIHDCWKNYSFD